MVIVVVVVVEVEYLLYFRNENKNRENVILCLSFLLSTRLHYNILLGYNILNSRIHSIFTHKDHISLKQSSNRQINSLQHT